MVVCVNNLTSVIMFVFERVFAFSQNLPQKGEFIDGNCNEYRDMYCDIFLVNNSQKCNL